MADDGGRKLWAAIAWGLGLLGLILVLVTDKKSDKELKFYGLQSVLVGVAYFVLSFLLGIIGGVLSFVPYVGWLGGILLFVVSFALIPIVGLIWLYGLWKAYSLEHFKLPLVGAYAEQFAEKL